MICWFMSAKIHELSLIHQIKKSLSDFLNVERKKEPEWGLSHWVWYEGIMPVPI